MGDGDTVPLTGHGDGYTVPDVAVRPGGPLFAAADAAPNGVPNGVARNGVTANGWPAQVHGVTAQGTAILPPGSFGPVPPGSFGPVPPALPGPGRDRRTWPWLVLVVVALLVGGIVVAGALLRGPGRSASSPVASSTPKQSAAAPSPLGEVGAIEASLAAMTNGVRTKDRAAFLSAVDARDSALVARESAVFKSLLVLPLQDATFAWKSRDTDPPAKPADYPPDALNVAVEFSYRFANYDSGLVTDIVTYTFAPVAGRWLIVGDSENLTGLRSSRWAEPWMTADVVVEVRPHVLVVGEVAHRTSTARLANRLEKVVGDVRKLWPERTWNGKVVAYAVTDKRFVEEWFGDQAATGSGTSGGRATFEARVGTVGDSLASSGDAGSGSPDAGPPRLIVTPWLLGQKDDYSVSVLRHEVTHVATARIGRYPPIWIVEGAAEYTGFRIGGSRVDAAVTVSRHGLPRSTVARLVAGTWTPKLVVDSRSFYGGSSDTVEDAYVDGWLACLYVADTYDDATLRRLYDVAATQPANADWSSVEASALRTVLRTDRAAFTESVRRYGLGLRTKLSLT